LKRFVHVASAALIACSLSLGALQAASASHPNASSKPPKLQKGVTLQVWDFFGTGAPERATETKVLAAFTKKTGIKVDTPQHPDGSNAKMCVGAPTGTAPDIIGVPHDQVSQMVQCGVIAPVPAWAWNPLKKGYVKGAVQAVTLSGKVYAMPWAIETTGLFYNKALITAKDFQPAKGQKYLTWTKLIKTLKAKTDLGSGQPGIGWDIGNLYHDYAFLSGNGGYVFKFTKKGFDWQNIGLDSSGAVKGIQFIKDLTTNGKYQLMPDSMTGSVALGLFTTNKLPVYLTGPWDEQNFDKANIKYGFVPDPSFDGKKPSRPFSGVQVYALNKYSKHPNEAAALLAYLTENMQIPEFKTSARIPVIKKLLNSKTVAKDPIASALGKAALAAAPMPNIPEMNQVWTPMGNALSQAIKNKATPSDAAKAAVAQIKSDIAKAHGG